MSDRTKALGTLLLGLVMMAGGGFFLWMEMRTPPSHSGHVYFFGSIAVLGALVLRPDPIFAVVQKVIVIAGQTNLPFIGGRRAGDPPAPPTGGAS